MTMYKMSLSLLALTSVTVGISGMVHELHHKNIDEFLRGKLFTLTFVDSQSCSRCRQHFPYFVAASQSFPDDPEIFFTRTHDKKLIQAWGIQQLPALVYHREGLSKQEILSVDVTVDDVVEAIARTLHGNFAGLTRTYSVHLNDGNYEELMTAPRQSVLILLHATEQKSEMETFERVAYAFRMDDLILFATLDVDKYQDLRDKRFKSRDSPTIIWLEAEDKTIPRRFGGVHSAELLTTFINERTSLNRNIDGALQTQAGLVPKAESVLQDHMEHILDADKETLKQAKEILLQLKATEVEHHQEMLKYYMYIVDKIADTGGTDVIKEMISALDRTLFGREEKSTRTEQTLKRRRNVLQRFQQSQRDFLADRETRDQETASSPDDKQRHLPESTVTFRSHSQWAHVHTEL